MSPNPKKQNFKSFFAGKKKTNITKTISPNGTKSIPFEGKNKFKTHYLLISYNWVDDHHHLLLHLLLHHIISDFFQQTNWGTFSLFFGSVNRFD
jgi:hypothetical protein